MDSANVLADLNRKLLENGVDFITAIEIIPKNSENIQVLLQDSVYGLYTANLKSCCTDKPVPIHKDRRSHIRFTAAKVKLEGKLFNGYLIKEVLKAKDLGYSTNGYYVRVIVSCGHELLVQPAHLRYKNDRKCVTCARIKHGERSKDSDGIRKKRSKEYIYWVGHKKRFTHHL